MCAAATDAGLVGIEADEEDVDIGIADPSALVDYRFGQAQFAEWLASRSSSARVDARSAAIDAIAETMQPYQPRVVFLSARTPSPA